MAALNPFSYGNPISDPRRFFGRRQEVEQIFSRLRNPEFESSSVVGTRRIGKTSLLSFLSHPTVVQSHGLDPDACLFVYVDLQLVGPADAPPRLHQYLLRRLQTKLKDPELAPLLDGYLKQKSLDFFDLSDLLHALDERGRRIVLLLDEFENIAANPQFGPEFYYGLRSLAIHHNLALITASQRDLVDLSHSEAVRASPFFNIFTTIHLHPFTFDDTKELLQSYLAHSERSFTDQEVERLAELTGGNPFFLQMASSFLFDAQEKAPGGSVRWDLLEAVFSAEVHPHLQSAWQSIPEDEQTVLTLLAILEAGRPDGTEGWSIPPTRKVVPPERRSHAGAGAPRPCERGDPTISPVLPGARALCHR
jgi:hypothetical protein